MSKPQISRRSYLSLLSSGGLLSVFGSGIAITEYLEWKKQTIDLSDKKIIGHRGANGLAPQNTKKGIKEALKYDVDGVELDVQLSSDGKLVLFHDPIYDISTDNGSGFVSDVPYETAKDFHKNEHYVITLEAALELIQPENVELYLELKTDEVFEKCIQVLEQFDYTEKTTFISLSEKELKPFIDEGYQTALINSTPYENNINIANEIGCTGIATHYTPIEKQSFINKANKQGFESIIWSLFDTKPSIKDSLNTKADTIIANRPDIIQELVDD